MKKAWEILKTSDFQRFLVEVFGIPMTDAKKLIPSQSLRQSISQGRLTEYITENEFEQLINLVESKQYEALLRGLEDINSRYLVSQQEKRARRRSQRRKERMANDPEYREKIHRQQRERYANNPEVRERQSERDKKRKADPEYKEKRNRQRRERLANDPEFREKEKRKNREYFRERMANDPEFREKRNRQKRERYRRKKGRKE